MTGLFPKTIIRYHRSENNVLGTGNKQRIRLLRNILRIIISFKRSPSLILINAAYASELWLMPSEQY